MCEIWKNVTVVPFSNYYTVSNLGNIKQIHQNSLRKQTIGSWGYKVVHLCASGKSKSFLVHRLVAMAFLENPENKTQVNHID